jgi:hypothetical protein
MQEALWYPYPALDLDGHVPESTASERRRNARAFVAVASGGISVGLELAMSNAAEVDEYFGRKLKGTITRKMVVENGDVDAAKC